MIVERRFAGWTRRAYLITVGLTLTLGCPAARTDYDYSEYRSPSSYAGGNEGVADAVGAAGTGAGTSTPEQGGAAPLGDAGNPDDQTGGASTGGTAASSDASGMNPDTDAEAGTLSAGAPNDYEIIENCFDTACGSSFASIYDSYSPTISQVEVKCTLTGLRDRTAGLYKHSVVSDSGQGLAELVHLLLVKNDQSVIHVSKQDLSGLLYDRNGTAGLTYTEAESCTLSPASYFDGCLAAVQNIGSTIAMEDPAWACLYVDPVAGWLTGCTPVEPSCE